MHLLPYILSLIISAGGIVAGAVLLYRKQNRSAITVFVATAAIAGAIIKLWHP